MSAGCDHFGVGCCFQAYLFWGGGIQRTPGDKVTVEKHTKKYTPGSALVGGVLFKGGVLSSLLYDTVRIYAFENRPPPGI